MNQNNITSNINSFGLLCGISLSHYRNEETRQGNWRCHQN